MIYITGDKHANFGNVLDFCYKYKTTVEDIMIVLGDAGINYHLNDHDYILKNSLLQYPITFFCVHGNHEERPMNIKSYKIKEFCGAKVYYEEAYPNILFSIDGEIYNFNNNKTLVIGGAYSVDKQYRLQMGYKWYESEQPDNKIKQKVLTTLSNNNYKVDVILSHTCPFKYMPYEVFLSGIDQEKVDKSTEIFLDEIETNTNYNKWYCGHYHTDKVIDKIRFMHHDIEEFIESRFTNA